MAQLVERSAVRIQSPAKFVEHLFTVNCIEKTKIKKKRLGMAHFENSTTVLSENVEFILRFKANINVKKVFYSPGPSMTKNR